MCVVARLQAQAHACSQVGGSKQSWVRGPTPCSLAHSARFVSRWHTRCASSSCDPRLPCPPHRVCIPVPLYHCFGMVIGNMACITRCALHCAAGLIGNET